MMRTARHPRPPRPPQSERGSFLLEALVAILIVSLGVLGLIGLYSRSIQNVDDTRTRAEAAALAASVVGEMWAYAGPAANATANLTALFDSTVGTGANYIEFKNLVAQRMPNGASYPPTVTVTAGPGNSTNVEITVQWQSPGEAGPHQVQFSAVVGSNL